MSEATATRYMTTAATAFLEALTEAQRCLVVFEFDDKAERENWHYVPRERAGLALGDMDSRQKHRAHGLLVTGLSAVGYERVRTIIELEEVLAQLEGNGRKWPRDPDLYYLTIFGVPNAPQPWGWRFEGHHVSLNYSILEGRIVSTTPLFFGANPALVHHGTQQGERALAQEEDVARQLLAALDGEQKKEAIVSSSAPDDILTRAVPHIIDEVCPEGLRSVDMDTAQREILDALVEVYLQRLPVEIAEIERLNVAKQSVEGLRFVWAGAQECGKAHYYRVHGSTYLAEYDNTQNDANHIHTVWRSLSGDFGYDALRKHYRQSHLKASPRTS